MSYKTIEYTIYDEKIMPNTLQSGGVAGDDNAVRVKFNLSNITLAANDKVRIEISNGVGGFNSSEHLTVANGCVYYDLPFDVTSAGGTAVLHLVICSCKDNIEQAVRYSYPAKIYFEESGCGGISYNQYKQGLSGLALECKSYSENAQTAADEAESSADEANQSATSAQTSQTAAQEAAAAAKASADSVTNAISEHNTDDDAHEAKFAAIDTRLSQMAPLAALSAAISAHNADTAAHGDIRETIALLQKHPCCEHSTSGGAVQRFDDVSMIPHNICVTVHGATDESGNSVTNPTVNVYGKNMLYAENGDYYASSNRIKVNVTDGIFTATRMTETVYNNNIEIGGTFTPKVSGNYTVKAHGISANPNSTAVNVIVKNKTDDSITITNVFIGGTAKTGTLEAGKEYQYFININSTNFNSLLPNIGDYITFKVQIEYGNTATEYEPYKEPQTVSVPMTFAEGEAVKISTFNAVSPTMVITASDDNGLINTVDVTYSRDIDKAIAALGIS